MTKHMIVSAEMTRAFRRCQERAHPQTLFRWHLDEIEKAAVRGAWRKIKARQWWERSVRRGEWFPEAYPT